MQLSLALIGLACVCNRIVSAHSGHSRASRTGSSNNNGRPLVPYPHQVDPVTTYDVNVLRQRPRECHKYGEEPMYFCPTPRYGDNVDWPCIRYSDLCNNAIDCPQGEDEHPSLCLFHNLHDAEMNSLRRNIHQLFLNGGGGGDEELLVVEDE